jgi:hypothetical protein
MTDRNTRENLQRILGGLGGDTMARVRFGDAEGEIFDVENPVSKALGWFEQLFTAMHDAGGKEAAKQGWAMLHILTVALAGSVNMDADIRRRDANRPNAAKGGATPRRIPWRDAALPLAKAYVADHPKYRKSELHRHIRAKKIDNLPVERAVTNQIQKWIERGDLIPSRK